jgi:hypothetical protein
MSTGKSKAGREELTSKVQEKLKLGTKKEAEHDHQHSDRGARSTPFSTTFRTTNSH